MIGSEEASIDACIDFDQAHSGSASQQASLSQNLIQSRLISIAYNNQTSMLRQMIQESDTYIDLMQIRDQKDFTRTPSLLL